MDDEIFEVVGHEKTEKMNCFKEFAGCGAHRLNNALWDGMNGVKVFDQAQEFAVRHHGPKQANTRWYGYQLIFVEKHIDLLNIDRSNSDNRSFSKFDPATIKQMCQVLEKIEQYVKRLESEEPLADNVLPTIKLMEIILTKMSTEERIDQEVSNFCCRQLASMSTNCTLGSLPKMFYGATSINPVKFQRELMTIVEKVEGRAFLGSIYDKIKNTTEVVEYDVRGRDS